MPQRSPCPETLALRKQKTSGRRRGRDMVHFGKVILKVTEPLQFTMSEVLDSSEHKPTASEISRQKHEWWWKPPKRDHRPSGRLRLTIESREYLGLRRSWSDGKKQRLEGSLGHFLVALTVVGKALKRQREEQAERQRAWEEERKRREEMAAPGPSTSAAQRWSRASLGPGTGAIRCGPSP